MTEANTKQSSVQFRLSAEQVRAGLLQWLPHKLAERDITIGEIVAPKGTGFSNQTFLLSAQWGGRTHALVLQAAPLGTGLFSRYDFANAARVQQQLAAVSRVPVANVRWHENDLSVLGVPFCIMDRVAGRAPTDKPPYHCGSWFSELSADEHARAWWCGIEALANLHRLDVERDSFAFLAEASWGMPLGANAAHTRIAQWRDFMAWADPEPSAPIGAALSELENTAPAARVACVHWGDAKLSNCMVDRGAITALLDWELCGLSVPEEDLAHWLMLDWSLWAVTRNKRLASLPSPAHTIARYEQLTNRETDNVLWWFRFGAVRLAIIYHRIMSILRERGHVPATSTLTAVNPLVPLLAPLFDSDQLP